MSRSGSEAEGSPRWGHNSGASLGRAGRGSEAGSQDLSPFLCQLRVAQRQTAGGEGSGGPGHREPWGN
jgi:hypothetical protein